MAELIGINEIEMQLEEQPLTPEQIAQIYLWLNSENNQVRLEALNLVKAVVSRRWPWATDIGIDLIVNAGFLPVVVRHLEIDVDPQLQFKAAWILINVSAWTLSQTQAVVASGAVPPLIRLLSSEDMGVVEKALWTLRNIAGDKAAMVNQYLEQMLNNEIMARLFGLVVTGSVGCLQVVAHLFSIFLSHGWVPDAALSSNILDAIDKLLGTSDDDVVEHCMYAISGLVDKNPEILQTILNKRLPSKFPSVNAYPFLHGPTLRATIFALGYIISHSKPEQTRLIITHSNTVTIENFLVKLYDLIMHMHNLANGNLLQDNIFGFAMFDAKIFKHSMFLLSNLLEEEKAPIFLGPIINAKLIEAVITMLKKGNEMNFSPELEVLQFEALSVLHGFTKNGSRDQIENLIETNSFQPLCELLKCTRSKVLRLMVLALLCIILSAVKEANSEESIKKFCDTIENCNGWKIIEELQNRKEIGIGDSAKELVDEYAKLVKSLMPQSQVPDVEMDPSRLYFHCTRSDML